MSAIKRYIEEYAEQHNLTFEAAAAALAQQQTARVPDPLAFSPTASTSRPTPIPTPTEPVLTQEE